MLTPSKNVLSVLLADDDMDDRMLFGDAVSELGLNIHLTTVQDGDELMEYLLSSAIVLPDLIFLDLNMPLKNGFQCLEEIRANKMLQGIHIIIYSTTIDPKDIEGVFNKGANLFVSKPNSFIRLKEILAKIFTLNFKEYFNGLPKANFVFK